MVSVSVSLAQGTAGEDAKYEYRNLIDMPTVGILNKGMVAASVYNMANGTVIAKIEAGVFDNFSFGFSYGGANVIGTGEIDWYKYPSLNAKYKIFKESLQYPAITVGFDMQGKGAYIDSTERFERKSPGLYVAVAKTFSFLGYLTFHGAISSSLERKDDDGDFNFYAGIEKTVGSTISVYAEYDLALNDNGERSLGDGSGYLSAGVKLSIADGFTLGFDLRNLIDNKKLTSNRADRAITIDFIKSIF